MKNSKIDLIDLITSPSWSLVGGINPPENKYCGQYPIQTPPIPKILILPLLQSTGSLANPIIKVGDSVLKGQLIAQSFDTTGKMMHAPSSGTVTAITQHPIAHPSGIMEQCIIITTDGLDQWHSITPIKDFSLLSSEQLISLIHQAGIAGLGGAGFPTSIKLNTQKKIHTLIINGVECEPYITADDRLMQEKSNQIITGIDILMHITKASRCIIAIEDNKKIAINIMQQAVQNSQHSITIKSLPTRYPSGGEKQLIYILTGKEVPTKKLPKDLGILMHNVGTTYAISEAIIQGKPLISRITTVTGSALQNPCNMEVLIGTPIHHLLKHAQLQDNLYTLIMGGSMMGFTIHDHNAPITKISNCIIAGTKQEFPPIPPEQPCIRCGFCTEVCPASLLPQQLYWYAKSENHHQLKQQHLFDCIECGACSYVCPSNIPLVQYYRASKSAIHEIETQAIKSEKSKQRFDQRALRLKDEQDKKIAKRKQQAKKLQENLIHKEALQSAIEKKISNTTTQTQGGNQLTQEQKKLKINLSISQTQLKKTQQALEKSKNDPNKDITQLEKNIQILQQEVKENQQKLNDWLSRKDNSIKNNNDDKILKQLKIAYSLTTVALKKANKNIELAQKTTPELQSAVQEAEKNAQQAKQQLDHFLTKQQ